VSSAHTRSLSVCNEWSVFVIDVTFAQENATSMNAVTRQFKSNVAAWSWPSSRYLAALWFSSVPKESFLP
jgi:hypothetical protein